MTFLGINDLSIRVPLMQSVPLNDTLTGNGFDSRIHFILIEMNNKQNFIQGDGIWRYQYINKQQSTLFYV